MSGSAEPADPVSAAVARAIRDERAIVMATLIRQAGDFQLSERVRRDIPMREGFDRDEYPPVVGRGRGPGAASVVATRAAGRADVRYVPRCGNRPHGAMLGGRLERFCNGTRFRYVFR